MVDIRILTLEVQRRQVNSRKKSWGVRWSLAFVATFGCLLVPRLSVAWDIKTTHQNLLDASVDQAMDLESVDSFLRTQLGMQSGFDEILRLTPALVLDGVVGGDLPAVYQTYYRAINVSDFFDGRLSRIRGACAPFGPLQDRLLELASLAPVETRARQLIRSGTWAEDNPNTRSRNHFHDPVQEHAGGRGLDNTGRLTPDETGPLAMLRPPGLLIQSLLVLGNACRGERVADLFAGRGFDLTGVSAKNRALNIQSAKLASPSPANHFDISDAERTLYRSLVGRTETERQHALSLHFLSIGHVIHLLQDMSSPAHVRNDFVVDHLLPGLDDFLDDDFGEQLETVGERKLAQDLARGFGGADFGSAGRIDSGPVSFLNAANKSSLGNPVLVDPAVFAASIPVVSGADFEELQDFWQREDGLPVAPANGLAEYVHDRFFSRATVPGRNVDRYEEPEASITNDGDCTLLPLRNQDGGVVESGVTGALAVGSFLSSRLVPHLAHCRLHWSLLPSLGELPELPGTEQPEPYSVVEDSVRWDYMELLFPLAVDYTRAFIEHYYQPRVEVVAAGEQRFRLRNLTHRDQVFFDDTAQIAYEGVDGFRHTVAIPCGNFDSIGDVVGEELVLAARAEGEERGPLSTFLCELPDTLPVTAIDSGDYWFVFRARPLTDPTASETFDAESLDTIASSSLQGAYFPNDFSVVFTRVQGRQIAYENVVLGTTDEDEIVSIKAVGVSGTIPTDPSSSLIEPVDLVEELRSDPQYDFLRPRAEPGGSRLVFLSDIGITDQRFPDDDILGNPIPSGVLFHFYSFDPGSRAIGIPEDSTSPGPRVLENGLTRLSDFSTPRGLGQGAAWSQTDDRIFFWDRSSDSASSPLRFFGYDLLTQSRQELVVEVPEGCDANIRPDIVAAQGAEIVAMTFFCDFRDDATGELMGASTDLFIMEVNAGRRVEAVQKVDMMSMTIQACGSVSGCPTANDFSGEGFGAAFSPDGTKMVFTSRRQRLLGDGSSDVPRHLFLADLQTGVVSPLETSRCVDRPSWSVDGARVAYLAGPADDLPNPSGIPACEPRLYDAYVVDPISGQSDLLHDFTAMNNVLRGNLTWYEPLALPSTAESQ